MEDFPDKNQIKKMDERELRDFLSSVHTEIKSILQKSNTLDNRLNKLNEISPSAQREYRKFTTNRMRLKTSLDDAKELISTCSEIKSEHDKIKDIRTDVENALKEIRKKRAEVNKFRNDSLSGNQSTRSRLKNLENLLSGNITLSNKHLSELEKTKDSIIKNEEAINQLHLRILDLLPGATTATLAFAFREAKKRYGSESIQEKMSDEEQAKIENMGWAQSIGQYWEKGDKTGFILYSSFVLSLLAIVGWSLYVFLWAEKTTEPFVFATQIVPILPLTWIATHLNRVINLRRKLYEEYNYRERLMILMAGLYEENNMNEVFISQELPKKIIANSIEKPTYIVEKSRDDNPIISTVFPFVRRISRKDIKEIVEEILIERETKGK